MTFEEMYDENLANREFELHCEQIGKNNHGSTTVIVRFMPYNRKHLIGRNSSWAAEKARVFQRLCCPDSWNMLGDFSPSMGVLNQPEILIGGVQGAFGFVWDEDDEMYYPSTCLLGDIRDLCERPMYKIVDIQSYDVGR